MINFAGLLFDIIGAWLLIKGEIQGNASFLRYQGSGEQREWFDREVAKLSWMRQLPLRLGSMWGSKDVMDMGQEPLFESFPRKVWALLFLFVGFGLQALATAIAMFGK
jgi:hypothetical protein